MWGLWVEGQDSRERDRVSLKKRPNMGRKKGKTKYMGIMKYSLSVCLSWHCFIFGLLGSDRKRVISDDPASCQYLHARQCN